MKQSFNNNVEELNKIPNTSGLYYFYDENGKIQYVGKAKNLKSRIRGHYNLNRFHREAMFLRKMIISKGFQLHKRDQWSEELENAWRNFEFKMMGKINMVVIDYMFHKIIRIEIEEIVHELTKSKETETIKKLTPPFNYQTASDEYYRLQEELE